MLGTPKKGRRFGGSASHQKAMMGNLVASLIAAEHLVTTEAKAKALRPVAEKVITPPPRADWPTTATWWRSSGTRTWPQAVRGDRAPVRRPSRRVHPDPEARPSPGRQRAHGADRTGVSPTPRPGGSGGPDEAPVPDASPAETVRWRLRLAYDGAPFAGFAPNTGQRTVAGELAEALSRVARCPVTLTCAGRTDAGVHALDQVVHTDLPTGAAARLDPALLLRSLNRLLAPSIVVREVGPAPDGVRRPPFGPDPALPVPGAQRPGGGPPALPPGLARPRPARPPVHAGGGGRACSGSTTSGRSAGGFPVIRPTRSSAAG